MKIGLDARTLTADRPRGTGRNLLDAYRLLAPQRPLWQFTFYHRSSGAAQATWQPPLTAPNLHWRRLDMPGDRLDAWFQLRLPLAARQDRLDLLHLPANAAPAWCPVPFVITIHDLAPLRVPGEATASEASAFRRGVERGIHRAAHIITVSQSTADDLTATWGVSAQRITVIPWAPDQLIAAAAPAAVQPAARLDLRARYGLAERWLISFAGRSARKNAAGTLAGFARVPSAARGGVQLVLIGCEPESWRDELRQEAALRGVDTHTRVLGFVPHADLPGLLAGSNGLLMPSRYEGFGLPILDAFACGTPVLTSDVSSMPEVAGDAALYCEPDAPDSIAAGIARLLDPSVARDLVERGRRRLAGFTWERTANSLGSVYERAADAARQAKSAPRPVRARAGR